MKIGRVKISPGFLLLAAWLNCVDRNGLFWKGMLSCFLHECGHFIALFLMGKSVKSINIIVCGAAIDFGHGMSYKAEICAAAAGPVVNFALAAILSRVPGKETAAGMNLALAVFNMLPAETLDGGRILRCVFGLLCGPEWGERAAERISAVITVMVCVAGVAAWKFWDNITLLLASAWLVKGRMENRAKSGRKSKK